MVKVYKKRQYVVYSAGTDYIIHNTKKLFEEGHTHIREFSTARWLIDLALHQSVPNRKLPYFIDSLIRISNDNSYTEKLLRYRK